MLEHTDMRRLNDDFGKAVRAVLDEHRLSLRAARNRTGIDHVTLSDMAGGYVPRMERVIEFAQGFGLDVREWLAKAGYDLPESGAERLVRGLRELEQRFGGPLSVRLSGGNDRLTVEDAESILEDIERQLSEEG